MLVEGETQSKPPQRLLGTLASDMHDYELGNEVKHEREYPKAAKICHCHCVWGEFVAMNRKNYADIVPHITSTTCLSVSERQP